MKLPWQLSVAASWIGTAVAAPAWTRDTSSVTTSGTSFVVDGAKGYLAGTNAYWLGFETNNADVDTVMSHLHSSGLKVLRVWGFNIANSTPSDGAVWYQSLIPGQNPAINTGTNGLQRYLLSIIITCELTDSLSLDYVVQSAEAHGIKLVINFNNNWGAYGGMPAYISYYKLADAHAWYESATAQATYQSYVRTVVSRYSNSSAIFAWELMNEPRCHGCEPSVLTNWAAKTSAYVKSLDSTRLVALGDEGFAPGHGDGTYPFTTAEGVDFAANLAIKTLDYGTAHLYPSNWGVNDTTWVTEWIQAHGKACVAANKPCVIEEYGYPSDHVAVEGPWQQTMLATDGIAMDQFWQYGDSLSSGQTDNDGFTIYYGSSEYKSLVTDHVQVISSSGR